MMEEKVPSEGGTKDAVDYGNGTVESIGEVEWTAEEEASVRRKFDFTIVPLVTVLYMLCAIDR